MTKTLPSTAVYAWTTLISALLCTPLALFMEGGQLRAGMAAAIAKVSLAISIPIEQQQDHLWFVLLL